MEMEYIFRIMKLIFIGIMILKVGINYIMSLDYIMCL